MSRKKTHEQYVAEVAAINPNIEVIGEYADAKTKILHRCKIDGYEWCVRPSVILQGSGCPRCAGVERYGHDEYVKRVSATNFNIEIVGKYVNSRTPILHRCMIDGYEWFARPANILHGEGCPRCKGVERYTQEEYVRQVEAINPNIEVIGEYVGTHVKILHMCKIDGYEWIVSPHNVLSGCSCPRCSGVERYSQDGYIKRVCEVNPDIEVIGEYAGAFMPILHKCKIDGYEWYAAPSGILQGYGCHKCGKRSKGEKIISNWLDDKCTLYIQQKTFDGCKDKQALPFDFYLPDYNIVIEYQGIQHYEPVEYFGGKDKFEYTVRHDTIKENYCKENNIRLIKIPYSADTYEELEKMYELVVKKEAIA